MVTVDVTWLGYFMALVSIYYTWLFILSRRSIARVDPVGGPRPPMALIVPAHNEEAVIAQTVANLLRLDYERLCVIVVNDGSTDETSRRARAASGTGRVLVVDRPAEVAGRGKGAVLNEGLRVLEGLLARDDPLIEGFDPDEVVVGVIDADGGLEPDALHEVARRFSDSRVGGVQMGVIIGNARDGLIPRCQDLEFVGFGHLAQAARDYRLGRARRERSVHAALGPPFTRPSAVDGLPDGRPGPRPQSRPAGLAHPLLPDGLGHPAGRLRPSGVDSTTNALGAGPLPVLDHLPGLLGPETSRS